MSATDEPDLELVARLRPEPTPDDATVARHRGQLAAAIQAGSAGSPTTNGQDDPHPRPMDASATAGAPRTVATPSAAADTEPAADPAQPSHPHTADHPGAVGGPGTDEGGRRVVSLTDRASAHGRGRGWLWTAVAAAAAVVVAVMAGLGTAGDLPTGGDQTVTGSEGAGSSGSTPGAPETATPPAPPEEAPCGTELPFELPAPASYEGPFPGPSDRVDVEAEMSPDTVQLHWRSAEGTIDVRWPSFPPLDPTTPYTAEPTSVSESYDRADGGRVREARVATTALGAGQCVEMGVIVTSDDPQVVERTLDQIEIGLVGPGGVLPSPAAGPLVAGTLQAAALPEVVACPETNQHSGGPVDDAGTHPTPREALAFFLVTEPVLSQWGYEEISLPDGSRGYALDLETFATGPYRPDEISDATDQPTTVAATVVHVVPQGDGWTVTSWRARAC